LGIKPLLLGDFYRAIVFKFALCDLRAFVASKIMLWASAYSCWRVFEH